MVLRSRAADSFALPELLRVHLSRTFLRRGREGGDGSRNLLLVNFLVRATRSVVRCAAANLLLLKNLELVLHKFGRAIDVLTLFNTAFSVVVVEPEAVCT